MKTLVEMCKSEWLQIIVLVFTAIWFVATSSERFNVQAQTLAKHEIRLERVESGQTEVLQSLAEIKGMLKEHMRPAVR